MCENRGYIWECKIIFSLALRPPISTISAKTLTLVETMSIVPSKHLHLHSPLASTRCLLVEELHSHSQVTTVTFHSQFLYVFQRSSG